ncbi:MAG TPA: hypothetical protein DCE56_06605 [Cyanobacteria bacterium UBA8553]|nr:hypothetical protein [Cyanobacteria bacterium UBA8553]
MSSPNFRPGDSGAWNLVFSETFESQPGSFSNSYRPIPSYLLPFSFNTFTLAFYVASATAKVTWIRGCIARQQVQTTMVPNGGRANFSSRVLPLREITIVQFPFVPTEFFLEFYFYWWFRDINVTVWSYNGVAFDPTTESLLATQHSLNQIIQRLPPP